VDGEPFVAGLPVCPHVVKLVGGAVAQPSYELDNAARRDEAGLDQRAERRGDGAVRSRAKALVSAR
jgi:hypothetical protein